MYILFAILIFGFLIFIHELGHFLTAKALDVQVNEFSICMGPAILKKQKGENFSGTSGWREADGRRVYIYSRRHAGPEFEKLIKLKL